MTARWIFKIWLVAGLVLASYYRQTCLDVFNLSYKFSRLHYQKNFVAELRVDQDSVFIYSEPIHDQALKIINLAQFQPIIKGAYQDYFVFVKKYYPEILETENGPPTEEKVKTKKLTIILVSPSTYRALTKVKEQDGIDSAGYVGFFDTIYLQTYGDTYNIIWLRGIIRHEIFHYLNNYYGLTNQYEEVAARRFGHP